MLAQTIPASSHETSERSSTGEYADARYTPNNVVKTSAMACRSVSTGAVDQAVDATATATVPNSNLLRAMTPATLTRCLKSRKRVIA
jgi:hypothetical protein